MKLALVQCAGHTGYRCRSKQIFEGAKDFFPNFLKLAQKILGHFLWEYFLMKTVFGMKKVFMWFCTCWGSIFSNQSTLDDNVFKSKQIGRHFCPYFPRVSPDFQRFCQGFHRFCPDFPRILPIFRNFARIFTSSKLLGVHLHPRLLHHWYSQTNCHCKKQIN